MKTILGKPSGIYLEDHIAHVVAEAQALLSTFPFVVEKYARLTDGKNLAQWLPAAAKYHDDGKKHTRWQTACQLDHQAFLNWQKQNPGKTFKDFEKEKPDLAGKNLREANIRHEIASVLEHRNHGFAVPVMVAIASHHAKLSERHVGKWCDNENIGREAGRELWRFFKQASTEGLDRSVAAFHEFRKFLAKYPKFAGVRAWLMTADQRASAREASEEVPVLKKFDYNFKWSEKKVVQQLAEENWQDDFLLLRAPTGAGKTDAALLWAKKQIENGRACRLVIAMPTRFTSNALSINIAENLSETGLYHSTAWQAKFDSRVKQGEVERQTARNEHEFARKLNTPVTVCTIDHLLMAFTLTREDHHQILFNLMNSCLVIDEADFYDEFTQANILVLLEALHEWKVPVLLMSASLPESSRTFYERSGFQISEIREDKSDLTRPRCRVDAIVEAEQISELEEHLEEIRLRGAGIIYANTVARAMEFYDWFEAKGVEPILYHSRFIEEHKKKKEEALLEALGKNGTGKGIAILTQIGEMSVNISADLMLSDICPIDRLVQRAGRLCRFDKNVGSLRIVVPQKNGSLYPAPYGIFKMPNWTAHRALIATIEQIENGKAYSAGDFVGFINSVYPDEAVFDQKAKGNANELKEYFVNNWIISSRELSREDAEDAHFWKSRDIEANMDVFVELPDRLVFNNWLDFQSLKNEKAIAIHPYLVRIGLEKPLTLSKATVSIDDTKQEITYVRNPKAYTYERGLDVSAEFDQFL